MRGLYGTSKGTFPVGPSEQWHEGSGNRHRNHRGVSTFHQTPSCTRYCRTYFSHLSTEIMIEAISFSTMITFIFWVLIFVWKWTIENGWLMIMNNQCCQKHPEPLLFRPSLPKCYIVLQNLKNKYFLTPYDDIYKQSYCHEDFIFYFLKINKTN